MNDFVKLLNFLIMITNSPIVFLAIALRIIHSGYCRIKLRNNTNWKRINGKIYESMKWLE